MTVIDVRGLSKHFGRRAVLTDCTFSVREQSIVALVGPNGAGKTTLLRCLVGLSSPSAGSVRVLGKFDAGSREALEHVAFVAQDAPLHRHLTVSSMIRVADRLNSTFDAVEARSRLVGLAIDLDARVGSLSGGQQAQLALALAIARRPAVLVLDEPLARLDPLARHEFMSLVVTAVAESSLSVVFSSHVVSELERVADELVLLSNGTVALAGLIEDLIMRHAVVAGPESERCELDRHHVVLEARKSGGRVQALVEVMGDRAALPHWEQSTATLEELVLCYLRKAGADGNRAGGSGADRMLTLVQ